MNKITYIKNTHIKSKNNNIKSDNTTSNQSGFFCCCPHKLNDESHSNSQNSKNPRTNSMVISIHYSDQIAQNTEWKKKKEKVSSSVSKVTQFKDYLPTPPLQPPPSIIYDTYDANKPYIHKYIILPTGNKKPPV